VNAHRDLDTAVARAYGWEAAISEEDALTRLLDLNRSRAAAQEQRPQRTRIARPGRLQREPELPPMQLPGGRTEPPQIRPPQQDRPAEAQPLLPGRRRGRRSRV